MEKELLNKMFSSCVEQKIYDFKEKFVEFFNEEFNKQCNKVAKEVNKELARFDVVKEGISIPLSNPKVKNAELFAIESDEDNVVVKFKLDGSDDEMEYKVPEEEEDFYKALEEEGFDSLDDELKEKISADLNEFVIDIDKKNESMERGEELKSVEMEANELKRSFLSDVQYQKVKKLKDFNAKDWRWDSDKQLYAKVVHKESVDMSKLTGAARLKALKDMAEKKKMEASKKANEENDSEMKDDEKIKEESKKKCK